MFHVKPRSGPQGRSTLPSELSRVTGSGLRDQSPVRSPDDVPRETCVAPHVRSMTTKSDPITQLRGHIARTCSYAPNTNVIHDRCNKRHKSVALNNLGFAMIKNTKVLQRTNSRRVAHVRTMSHAAHAPGPSKQRISSR